MPVGVHFVVVSEWKKRVIGNGNASKAVVLAWARALRYDGERQDPADALAIAAFAAWRQAAAPVVF